MTDYAAEAARLRVEVETLRAEVDLLRAEGARISTMNGQLQAQLALAEAEREKLRGYTASIERSRPWRAVQVLRGIMGRRW